MSPRGRGLRLGLGLALFSWAGLALLDGGHGAFLAPVSFETTGERQWFLLLCALCLLGPAILLGLCQGAVGPLLMALARRLARSSSRARTAPWLGRLLALLCAPAVAAVCAQIFRGPRAQRIPGHDLMAVALGVGALYALSVTVPAILRLREWVDESGPRRRARAILIGGSLWALCAALYAMDARVLPRLYPWFHASLLALILATGELAALFCALGATGLRRRWLNDEHLALGITLIAACAGAWGFLRLDRAQVLRAAAMEHTALAGRALKARHLLGSGRAPQEEAETAEAPDPESPAAGKGAQEALPPGPRLTDSDVFLITVDALRDDRLGGRTMPAAAALEESGVRFERAYTQVPHTSFAVATLLTGKPVYALLALGQDAAEHETLPMVLRRARYKTAAFYPPSVFFIEHERLKRLEESSYGFEYVKYEYLDAKRRTDQVIDFLKTEQPARTFVWVHYLDPHEPYDLHPETGAGPGAKPERRLDPRAPDKDRYDGEVRFVDQQIARLLAHLRETRPRALIVLCADHGEEFGEHGGRYHGTTLYEEQVRVPLLFADLAVPSRLPTRRAPGPVGLIDVAPTILRLLDIAPSARMRGHDLGPWLGPSATRAAPPWPVFGEIGRKKMVVQGADKLICDLATDTCASYDLARDPGETRNLIDAAPARAGALREQLRRYLSEASRFERRPGAPGPAEKGAGPAGGAQGREATSAEERDALVRARLGDRDAMPGLSRLIAREGAEPALWQEAVALLGQLCLQGEAGEDARAALRRGAAGGGQARRWAQVGLSALGQPLDQPPLADIIQDEQADPGLRVAAAQALVVNAAAAPDRVALLTAALPVAMALDDPDRARPLIQALGQSRDPRALPALQAQLDNVRSRVDVTRALGALGQRQAVPALSRLLLEDPYVPVRAAAAEALGAIGLTPASASVLAQAARREREAPVQDAIRAAQRALHRPAAPKDAGAGRPGRPGAGSP